MSEQRVEAIRPYDQQKAKAEQVRQMFDNIAPAYDFMNRAMTLGVDRWWRRVAVKKVAQAAPRHILDVATGTGDFALALYDHIHPEHIDGIDLSDGMLEVARRKAAQRDLQQHITFVQGDCLALPYPDESMDAVTVAFGVRNFEHIDQGYREMYRVLKPGGTLCVVELSTPTNRVVRWFYDLYTLHIIPFVGSLKSGDRDAYRYLPLSIAAVPQGEDMLELMRQAGFGHGAVQRLTFGTCSIYTAQR